MSRRYLMVVAVAVVTILSIQMQSISGLSISAQPKGNVTIKDFDIFEVGITLDEGQKIAYSYNANSFMIFQLHRHEGNEIILYYMTEGRSHSDTFTAPKSGDYYWLWENDGVLPSKLTYEVLLPKSVHRIDYNGSSYNVEILSNSKVENIAFNAVEKQLIFNIQTPYLTPGFANVTLPEKLLSGEFNVEGGVSQYFVNHTSSSSHIVVKTDVGTHSISIHASNAIPEFGYSFLVLSIAIVIFLSWRFIKIKFAKLLVSHTS